MKIAFIGLGAMGYPMARHLSKEHEVLVWNRTREKAERHAREHGTTLLHDLAGCADAEVIITMLPTSTEVDEIVDRLLPQVKSGTLWIDATSGDPNVSRGTAKRLAENGKFSARTRHIRSYYHYTRREIDDGHLILEYVPDSA